MKLFPEISLKAIFVLYFSILHQSLYCILVYCMMKFQEDFRKHFRPPSPAILPPIA